MFTESAEPDLLAGSYLSTYEKTVFFQKNVFKKDLFQENFLS